MAHPPSSSPSSYVDTLRAYADRVYPTLGERSYYEVLNVPPTANLQAVRAAFYKLAGQLHPDRFHSLADVGVRERLETIYARVGEAYRVLGNPEKRVAYDKVLAAGKKRLETVERSSGAPRNPEDSIKHSDAKKFFRMGMVCLSRKDWKGAVMNFNFARGFEPGATVVAEKLAEAQAGLASQGGQGKPPAPKSPGPPR
jgi:curved DNA-binding protein CbpA